MNKAAQQLGSLGGKARAKNLSRAERSRIARLGALARHGLLNEPDTTTSHNEPQAATKRAGGQRRAKAGHSGKESK